MQKPTHLVFILADEHRRDVAGCYGNEIAQTPNLDALAARGTRFMNAYTNSPICVPARAALATGYYPHQTGHWDNAHPYHGEPDSWMHHLRGHGHRVDVIGKLHFRSAPHDNGGDKGDDNGFSQEIETLHVAEGTGEIIECLRGEAPRRPDLRGVQSAGPGDSSYLRYDRENTERACRWIEEHADDETPWALFLSFVCPHPPFIAPPDLYDLYANQEFPLPPQWRQEEWPDHPALAFFREHFRWEDGLGAETIRRATATYYALCTFVDRNVGQVMQALRDQGITDSTRILYSSDHGAMLGARGQFNKLTMYEQASAIPMILAGPDVPVEKVVETPVSLVDCFPTILESFGIEPPADDGRPGESLWSILRQPDHERTVFSEYHAAGSRHATFMVTDRRYKYIHYTHETPHFFDKQFDPLEVHNLSTSAEHQPLVREYERRLRAIVDPEAIDARCKAEQMAKVEAFGGKEAVIRRGLSNSPVPGEKPVFHHASSAL